MSREYGFDERMKMSDGFAAVADVESILMANVVGALNVHRAHEKNDRSGTDWWVEAIGGKHLSIDAKVRSQDYAAKNGEDDIALETWSVVEKQIIGWTRDTSKQTDYVLWLWLDTGRWMLVPFPMLCAVFSEHWQNWLQKYKNARQYTPRYGGGYHSECVFVPRRELWASVYTMFGGTPVDPVQARAAA